MNKTLIIAGIISGVVVVCCAVGGAMLAVNMQSSVVEDKVPTASSIEVKEKLNGWKQKGSDWYYYKDDEEQTGWIQDKNNWYYLNNDGTMATNITVDGCYLNEKGLIEETPNRSSVNSDYTYSSCLEYAKSYFENSHQSGYKYNIECDKNLNAKGEYTFLFYNKSSGELIDGCYVNAQSKNVVSLDDLNSYGSSGGQASIANESEAKSTIYANDNPEFTLQYQGMLSIDQVNQELQQYYYGFNLNESVYVFYCYDIDSGDPVVIYYVGKDTGTVYRRDGGYHQLLNANVLKNKEIIKVYYCKNR